MASDELKIVLEDVKEFRVRSCNITFQKDRRANLLFFN
jgi:hypothetical protein